MLCCGLQLGELELLVPPPPSSAAVVAFALQFLAGYGNTLQSSSTADTDSLSSTQLVGKAGGAAAVLASFGVEPQRDKAQGMHRLVRSNCCGSGFGRGGAMTY